MRELQHQQRDYIRKLVADNPDLAQHIRDQRQRLRQHHREGRHDMIEHRRK